MRYAYGTPLSSLSRFSAPQTRISPRSRYISHSSSFTHDFRSSRARCSARRSRPGSYAWMSPRARASRRARRRSDRFSKYGSITSHSRATTTIAVAQRATVTSGLLRPARGPREEDHPIGRARDVLERAHHLGLPPATFPLDRDRGPHPLLELMPELGDQPLLVLAQARITFGDQLLAIARTHPQELHGRIMSRGLERPDRSVAPIGRSVSRLTPVPSTLTGPVPRPISPRPSRTASDAMRLARSAASNGENPSARCAASA